jgi:hypothetical protein
LLITLKADIIAPTAPTMVASVVSTSALSLSLAAASTDAGGLKEYVLERSLTSTGTYTEIARGLSIFPYADSGLSSATTYFYRCKAIDVSLNEGNYSSIANATTDSVAPATSVIRFAPGHYKWIDTGSGGGGQTGELAQIAALSGKSYMAGAKWVFDWDDIETTQGNYVFTKTDAYVSQAASVGKKIMLEIKFQYFGSSTTSPSGKFPAYLATLQGGSPGYTLWDGVNPASPAGSLVAIANLWNATVMDAYIAASTALANRYKDNVTVVMFAIGETSIANLPGSGYVTSTWITQLKRWMLAMRAAWPNTEIRVQTNYLDTSAQMQDLIAYAYANRIACGGPDNYSRIYDSNPIYTGNVGGIDYRNRMSWVSESQYPASSSGGPSATSAQIYAHNESGALASGGSTKPNYYVWFNNTFTNGGLYHTYPAETEPFIASISGACNTANPYAEVFDYYISPTGNDANAGTVGSPWAITALATKAATYKTKRVGLLDGTYRFSGTPGISIPATASGTAANHTVIKSVNARQAIMTNNTNGAGAYVQDSQTTQCVLVNANFVDFVNLYITDCSGHGLVLQDVDTILVDSCKITNCKTARNTSGLSDTNHGGIYCFTQSIPKTNVTVRNCEIGDILRATDTIVGNNSNAIGDLFGANTWVIENNTVYRCGTLSYWKGQTGNHTIRNNFVYDCGVFLQGYAVEEVAGATTFNRVYNNVALVNAMGGPQSGNTHNGATLTEVYNNTIIIKPIAGQSDTGFGSWTASGLGSPSAIKLYNNLIFVDPSMAASFQEFYTQSGSIAPRLRYTTNGGLRDYNTYSVFRIFDGIGGTNFDGSAGLTAIRLSTGGGWSTDSNTEIRSNFGFVGSGNVVTSYALTGTGVPLLSGKVGGISSGVSINRGAYDGLVTQIGKDW